MGVILSLIDGSCEWLSDFDFLDSDKGVEVGFEGGLDKAIKKSKSVESRKQSKVIDIDKGYLDL